MYCFKNYKTKEDLRKDMKNGREVMVEQNEPFGDSGSINGLITIEGPKFIGHRRWCVSAEVINSVVQRVAWASFFYYTITKAKR